MKKKTRAVHYFFGILCIKIVFGATTLSFERHEIEVNAQREDRTGVD